MSVSKTGRIIVMFAHCATARQLQAPHQLDTLSFTFCHCHRETDCTSVHLCPLGANLPSASQSCDTPREQQPPAEIPTLSASPTTCNVDVFRNPCQRAYCRIPRNTSELAKIKFKDSSLMMSIHVMILDSQKTYSAGAVQSPLFGRSAQVVKGFT